MQALLQSNAEFLESQGCLYPLTGRTGDSHAGICLSVPSERDWLIRKMIPWHRRKKLLKNEWRSVTDNIFFNLSRELRASRQKTAVISSECFLEFLDVQALKHQLATVGLEPEIIVYIRRQDRWIESVYSQVIQDPDIAYSKGFDVMPQHRMLDFESELDQWIDAFGAANIHAIPYYENGRGAKVGSTLGNAIGLGEDWMESPSVKLPARNTNASLDECCVETLRIMNKWPDEQGLQFRNVLSQISKEFENEGLFQTWRLPNNKAQSLVAEHRDRNKRLFSKLNVVVDSDWGELGSRPQVSLSSRAMKLERILQEFSKHLKKDQMKTLNRKLIRAI